MSTNKKLTRIRPCWRLEALNSYPTAIAIKPTFKHNIRGFLSMFRDNIISREIWGSSFQLLQTIFFKSWQIQLFILRPFFWTRLVICIHQNWFFKLPINRENENSYLYLKNIKHETWYLKAINRNINWNNDHPSYKFTQKKRYKL